MSLACAAFLLASLLPGQGGGSAPLVRVAAGAARVAEGQAIRSLPSGTSLRIGAAGARVEAPARSEIEVVWHGQASARIGGPAAFDVQARPGLVLEGFQVVELEVRRGTLALVLADLGPVELGAGVLQARALPGGGLELRNRGGTPLALSTGSGPLRIQAGRAVRVREEGR